MHRPSALRWLGSVPLAETFEPVSDTVTSAHREPDVELAAARNGAGNAGVEIDVFQRERR